MFDQLLDISPSSKIQEVGSGNGELWTKNLDRIPANWDVTLSDFSSGMLDKVRAYLQARTDFQYEIIDVQSIPFPATSFDVTMVNRMLYHVPDIPRALSELRRVLRPEGVFYATTIEYARTPGFGGRI